jgi:dihydroneopterin aldolase/2-amino-4-hydroxy-6-hydroxymethyldihydropteridine diphosphokinase
MADVVAVSPLYETDPVGGPEQDAYFNIVVELDTTATPRELLERCRALEMAADRRRVIRWGPRTLDVDILLVGDLTVDDDDLAVPHPRMHERNFVMRPLLDLDPAIAVEGFDPDAAYGDVRSIGPL